MADQKTHVENRALPSSSNRCTSANRKHSTATWVMLPLLVAVAPSAIAADAGMSELGFGYGVATSNELVDSFLDGLSYPATLGSSTTSNEEYSGAFFVDYRHAMSQRWMVGAELVYEENSRTKAFDGNITGKEEGETVTVAVRVDYNYVNNASYRVFSGLGVGYTFSNQQFTPNPDSSGTEMAFDEDDDNANLHLAIIGLRLGGTIGFVTELGFGYKGIINAGINYRF